MQIYYINYVTIQLDKVIRTTKILAIPQSTIMISDLIL